MRTQPKSTAMSERDRADRVVMLVPPQLVVDLAVPVEVVDAERHEVSPITTSGLRFRYERPSIVTVSAMGPPVGWLAV